MDFKKRLIAIIIILSMMLGSVTPAYAAPDVTPGVTPSVEETEESGEETGSSEESSEEGSEPTDPVSPSVSPSPEAGSSEEESEDSSEQDPDAVPSGIPTPSGSPEAETDMDLDITVSPSVSPVPSAAPVAAAVEDYSKYPTGYLEVPEDEAPESVKILPEGYSRRLRSSSLDSSYVNPNLPPLRSQGSYRSCWAFSSIALAELYMIQQGKIAAPDMSESHLAYFSYNSVVDPLGGTSGDSNRIGSGSFLNIGGNLLFSQNVLASWMGAADESAAPYEDANSDMQLEDSLAYEDMVHLTDYYEVNISQDRDAVKKLIMQNGGVSVSYYSYSGINPVTEETTYNRTNNCYYNPTARTDSPRQNHAVTIVGWNDDFPAESFAQTPAGNGAWLVRNSWMDGGTYEDEQTHNYAGYFWMSYYEATLYEKAFSFIFDSADNYDHNHQYDGAMYTTAINLGNPTIKAANIFSTKEDGNGEYVKAASFYSSTTNVTYTIDIYRRLENASDPESGQLVSSVTGTAEYAGYHTVPLDNEVYVRPGDRFSVVVTLEKEGFQPTIGMEKSYTVSQVTINASLEEGQSFVCKTSGWVDIKAENEEAGRGNLRIKAYSDDSDKSEYRLIFKLDGGRFNRLTSNSYSAPMDGSSSANDAIRAVVSAEEYEDFSAPIKAGYDFDGWYTTDVAADQNNSTKFDFDSAITEDTYVYARWKPKDEDESLLETKTVAEDGQMYRVTARAEDKVFSNKEGNYLTTVTVTDMEAGKKLKAGTDYDKDVIYSYVRDTELYDGSIREAGAGTIYNGKMDIVPAGTTLRVCVEGKGRYDGVKMYTSFRVVEGDISKASVKINPQYYTGEKITPDYNQIVVKVGGDILNNRDYDIVSPSIGNIDPTTGASITIKGKGDYGGSKTVKFTILERPEQSIISFNPNGATSGKMKDIKLEYGKEYTLTRNAFKRSYYEFTGWNTEPDGDTDGIGIHYDDKQANPIMTGESDPAEVYILYAQWSPVEYRITYHCNGGPNNDDNMATGYNAESDDIPIKAPEREDWPVGYQFGGWYTDSSYRNKTNVIKSGSHGDIDLYAKWVPYTYTVHFDANGGTGTMNDETFSYGVPKAITANKFKKEGYVFCGWTVGAALTDADTAALLNSTDSTEEDFAALADYANKQSVTNILDKKDDFKGEVTLYALWRNTYRVSFDIGPDARWGNAEEEILPEGVISAGSEGAKRYYRSYSYGTGLDLPAATEIYRPGYSFGGWYKDPMYKSKLKSITKKQTGEITLYAKWNPLKYKIAFKPAFNENGKGMNSGKMSTLTCTYGNNTSLPANAYISMGYIFKGWSVDEDDSVEFADLEPTRVIESYEGEGRILPTKNNQIFDLYAVWEGVSEYEVRYEKNGGHFIEYVHVMEEYDPDEKLLYSDLPTADHIEKAGYKFMGWYTDPACKKKFSSVKGRNITLYAKWTGIAKYSVDYLPNLPEGVTRYTGKMARSTGFVVGASKALRKNSFKIPGYTFIGWKTKGKEFEEDAEKKYEYENGESINFDNSYFGYPIIDGVLTLEAVWHKDTYGIVYNNTVGAFNDDNPVTYEVDTEDIILKEPQMTGNTFLGWYSDKRFKKKITKIPKGSTGTKTLYAKWKAMYYTIQYDLNPPTGEAAPVLDMTHVGYIVSYDKNYDGGYLLPTASLEGYTFGGWYKDKKGKKKVGQVIKSPYVDLVLYAKWIADINVTYPRITGEIEEPATYYSVIDFGAVPGDGLDDLAAFRAAMDKAAKSSGIKTVYVPAGVYDIKPENPHKDGQPAIHLKNNVNIVMDRNAILKATPVSMSGDFCVICGEENDNVTITGGQIWGERASHMGKAGESGHGIYLAKCSNITIEKMVIKSNWGDGIYVADRKVYDTFMESENITIDTCELVDNRRNNISLISGKGVNIINCEIEAKRTGHSPDCGICVEPNWHGSYEEKNKIIYPSQYIENLLVKDTRISAYKPDDSDYRSFMTLQYAPKPDFTTATGIRFENSTFNGYIGNYSGRNLTYDSRTRFNATFDDWCNAKKVD